MIKIRTKFRISLIKMDVVTFLISASFTLLILSEMFEELLPDTFTYADEVLSLVALIYICIRVLQKRRFSKIAGKIVICLALMILLGFMGNFFYSIQYTWTSAILDAFLFAKIYIVLVFSILSITNIRCERIYTYILFISKFFLTVLCLATATSALINGLEKEYDFYYGYYGALSWWSILFFSVIYSDKSSNRILFYIMTAIIVFVNSSGLGILSLGAVAVFYVFVEKNKRIEWYHLVILGMVCVTVGYDEITGYLTNDNAARYLLLYYSFVTANRFFPLGSGFATYASAQAAKQYSKLYYEYGFNSVWGMTKQKRSFLQDSYYPVVIGQFGYLGVLIFATLMIVIIKYLILPITDSPCRCGASIALFIWLAAGMGFLGGSTSWGCCIFMIIVVLQQKGKQQHR